MLALNTALYNATVAKSYSEMTSEEKEFVSSYQKDMAKLEKEKAEEEVEYNEAKTFLENFVNTCTDKRTVIQVAGIAKNRLAGIKAGRRWHNNGEEVKPESPVENVAPEAQPEVKAEAKVKKSKKA